MGKNVLLNGRNRGFTQISFYPKKTQWEEQRFYPNSVLPWRPREVSKNLRLESFHFLNSETLVSTYLYTI